MTSAPSGEKQDITLAKGLGITLVVVGHILGRGTSEGNAWAGDVKAFIYLFHMAFFMYLSGYVFFRPGRLQKIHDQGGAFILKQSIRLLLPFVVMGVTILMLKVGLKNAVHVDNAPGGMLTGLRDLFWTTSHSPSMFIWYIFVLYIYTLASLLLFPILKERMMLWLALALLLYLLPSIPYMYLNKITAFFVFFVIGGVLHHCEIRYNALLDQFLPVWLLIWIISFGVYYNMGVDKKWCLLIIGMTSIPALHGLCRWIVRKHLIVMRPFYLLGQSSYTIYLFNTLAIGAAKAAIFKFTDWNGLNFLWVAPVLIASGLVLPYLLETLVLMRISPVRKHILGK